MNLDDKIERDAFYIMNLNEIKQEAPGIKLLEHEVTTIKSHCKLESPTSSTLEPVESDGNIFVKQEVLHEELDIKSEDEAVFDKDNQPCKIKKVFKCNICGRSFKHNTSLKNHLRIHTGEKPFKCNICDSDFSLKGYLKKHLRTHTGEKPFKCNVCERSFTRNSSLKTHLRTHTGEKPFKCNLCDYRSIENSYLQKHLRIHSEEKLFKCNICDSSFRQQTSLQYHLRIHTGENPIK